MIISSEHLSSLTNLFAGDSFGEDINYDPEFDLIKVEIGKLGNLDYQLLEQKSLALIKEKSKDVRLFSFLALCYLKRNEWELFCDTFEALGNLAEKNYKSLFPTRARAKQLAFKWLTEDRFIGVAESTNPPSTAHEHIKRLLNGLDIIKKPLDAEFPEGSPFPLKFYSIVSRWVKSTEPKKVEAVQPKASSVINSVSNTAQNVSVTQDGAKLEIIGPENSNDALEIIRKMALFLIEKEPQKAIGYRLIRVVRWNLIEKAPIVDNGATTKVAAPLAERRAYIQSLLGKGDFKVALETSENSFSAGTTHFWLDLQRISATAAKQMGFGFNAVRDAIILETALFLKRIPQIKDFTYSDGTPFCDSATHDWIKDEVLPVFSSETSVANVKTGDAVEADRREINELVAANNVDKALELLLGKIASSNSERDNFRRRIVVAKTMLSAKRSDLSIYILEYLDETISKFNLHLWEPELAAEALSLLAKAYAVYAAGKQGQGVALLLEKREKVIKLLSFIDPIAAYKLK